MIDFNKKNNNKRTNTIFKKLQKTKYSRWMMLSLENTEDVSGNTDDDIGCT